MRKYELSQIGQFHTNFNEDYLVSAEVGVNQLMIAVMDGCSTGTDSYFASTMIGKVLRKIAKDQHYKEFINKTTKTNDALLKETMKWLFNELIYINSRLDLRSDELLSTIILGIVDTQDATAELLVIGDGLICYNGIVKEYEQDNKPDYLGYHLTEQFETWYARQEQRLSLKDIRNLSISTDGLFTFKNYDNNNYDLLSEAQIIQRFLLDTTGYENENMLKKTLFQIEKENGLKPTDDLTIIRLINKRTS